MPKFDKKLGVILSRYGLLTEEQRDTLLAETEKANGSLTQAVLERKLCTEVAIISAVSQEMGYHPVNLERVKPDAEALKVLSEEQCTKYLVLPLAKLGNALTVAAANPFDVLELDNLHIITSCEIVPVITTDVAVRKAIKDIFIVKRDAGLAAHAMAEEVVASFSEATAEAQVEQEEESENSAPIVKLSHRIIEAAYDKGASDIHIEPMETKTIVRYRIDGVCKDQMEIPKSAHRALISRLKIMSELNISERRVPQDGRIVYKKYNSRFDLDLRVSVAPMNFGEKICMRILDKTKSCLPLDRLGFSDYNLKMYRDLIQVPYGMILHCGPTGSGKSMTLFAALNEINSPDWNICTAEDPIEYTLPRLNQMQTKKEVGLTFANALRCFLRQDPDIILVGEIRDLETAEIAIEAALTGHVLFSTLHTNDAPSTLTRFQEMGVEPFMVATCLVAVCAQRLVRRLCPCRKEDVPTAEEAKLLSRALDGRPVEKLLRPAGCPKCLATGFKGRCGTHELLCNTDELRTLVSQRANADRMKEAARAGGMRTLFEDLMEKVKLGITSLPEALACARPDDKTSPLSPSPWPPPEKAPAGGAAANAEEKKQG